MGVEDYKGREPFTQGLPPKIPLKERGRTEESTDRIWDVDFALRGLLIEFRDPMLQHERVFRSCASFVRKQAIGRWQLGYKAKIDYLPDGDAFISFPSTKELAKNNRYRHSIEVAKTLVRLGKGSNLGEEDLFLLGVAGLVHDFEHPVFSHVGENFFREAASFAQRNDPELAALLEEKGLHADHEERLLHNINAITGIGIPLHASLSIIGRQRLNVILQEKGPLGELLKIADTIAYLELDSIDRGYKPPHFEQFLRGEIIVTPDGLMLKNFPHGREILQRLLEYRHFMYMYHYEHPFNKVIEEMQKKTLFVHLVTLERGESRASAMEKLLDEPDEVILARLRTRTLVRQWPTGLAFFGIPYKKRRVSSEGEVGNFSIDSPYVAIDTNDSSAKKSIRVLDGEGNVHIVATPLPQDELSRFLRSEKSPNVLFYPPDDFLAEVRPVIENMGRNVRQHLSSLTTGDFNLPSYRLSEVWK